MPTTPRATKPEAGAEDTTQTLAYWMGRVDASILEIKKAVDGLAQKDDSRWSDFEKWRREVDDRLQRGSSKFEDHARRIGELETEVQKMNGNGKPKPAEPEPKAPGPKPGFGSWDWFRDGYLEKIVLIVVTVIIYKLIEIIVTHWQISP